MPTTFEALLTLFFFSVPAYLAIAVYKKHNPIHYYRTKQSPLAEAFLYAFLGGLVIVLTISFLVLLWLLATLIRNWLPTGATLILADNSVDDLLVIAIPLIFAYYATGATFSFLVGRTIPYVLLPEEPPLWVRELFMVSADALWLLVHLKGGDRCLGLVSRVRWLGDKDCTMELTLEKAFYQLADSKEKEPIGRVLLRSDDILWLSPYSE